MKTNHFVATAALAMLVLTGCSDTIDEVGETPIGQPVKITLQATGDKAQSRGAYTGTAFSWTKGDKLSVIVGEVAGNENCLLTAEADGANASFGGSANSWKGEKSTFVFYPYSSAGYTVDGAGNATITLSNAQTYTIGGSIDNSLMVGTGKASVTDGAIKATVDMKQVMSIIKLNITNAPGKVTGVKLKCGEAIFPTKATVAMGTGVTTNPNDLVKELSMSVTDNTSETTKSVSFAMLPANLTGKTIEIEVTFDGSTTKAITKSGINFARNTHYLTDFDATTLTPYIEIGGLKWAAGNLVADGAHGAKIGNPKDYGLIFQFGSLIGWSSVDQPLVVAVSPANFEGGTAWSAGHIWTDTTNPIPFTEAGSGSAEEKAGLGDPCHYYLKGTWRLPTKDEFNELFNVTSADVTWSTPWSTPWSWNSGFASHTNGFTLPAAGLRNYISGYSSGLASAGYYWSSTLLASGESSYLYFYSGSASRYNDRLAYGYSVRCVQ